jgi:hypothetical protein
MGTRQAKLISKYSSILFLAVVFLFTACSKEKSDEYLLEQDRIKLDDKVNTVKVQSYKLGKIVFRASVDTSLDKTGIPLSSEDMNEAVHLMSNLDERSPSVMEYLKLFRQFKKVRKFVAKTDEDIYPPLSVAFATHYPDSLSEIPTYSAQEELNQESLEHTALSLLSLGTPTMGMSVALYEASEVNSDHMDDVEIRVLSSMFKGFIYQQNGLLYLGEQELSSNIAFLETDKTRAFPLISHFMGLQDSHDTNQYNAVHGMNYLFRGIDRLLMERDVDQSRAVSDFEMFLYDAGKMGYDNELTWTVEAYVHIENGETEEAIVALKKLQNSPLLGDDEKETIGEYITHLEDQNPDAVFNSIKSKVFISKIAASYATGKLADVDWKDVLSSRNVKNADDVLSRYLQFTSYIDGLQSYLTKEKVSEGLNKSKDQVDKLWDKAENLVE